MAALQISPQTSFSFDQSNVCVDWCVIRVFRSGCCCQSITGEGNRPPICEDHPHPSPTSQQPQPPHSQQHSEGNRSVIVSLNFALADARHEHTCVFSPGSSCSSGLHGERSTGPSAARRSVHPVWVHVWVRLLLQKTCTTQLPAFRILLKYYLEKVLRYFIQEMTWL